MRVHIVLDLEQLPSPELRKAAAAMLQSLFELKNVNWSRVEHLGILSADIKDDGVKRIAAHRLVKACEHNKEQHAL